MKLLARVQAKKEKRINKTALEDCTLSNIQHAARGATRFSVVLLLQSLTNFLLAKRPSFYPGHLIVKLPERVVTSYSV